MAEGEDRIQELIRVVGRERQEQPPELVASAEEEIIRRTGGTRAQAVRRLRWKGAACLVIAVGCVALSVSLLCVQGVPLLRDHRLRPNMADDISLLVPVLILIALAAALFVLGMGLLRLRPWAVRRRRFLSPVSQRDVRALTVEPDLAALLDTVGPSREGVPSHAVAASEAELASRLADARTGTITRVRNWGWVAIGWGLYSALGGMLAVVMMLRLLLAGPESYPIGPGPAGLLHVLMMCWMGLLNVAFGWALFASGIGLRRRRQWARKSTYWLLWIMLAAGTGMIPYVVAWMVLTGFPLEVTTPMFVMAMASSTFWVLVFATITRTMRRPEIREVFSPPPSEETPAERKRFQRRMLAIASVPVLVPIIAPMIAYAVWWQRSATDLDSEIAQLRQSGAVIDFEEWKPALPPEADNGVDLFRQAMAAGGEAHARLQDAGWPDQRLQGDEYVASWTEAIDLEPPSPLQQQFIEVAAREHKLVLDLLRQSAGKPGVVFDRDYSLSDGPSIVYDYSELRRAAWLADASSLTNLRKGDYAQAVADARLALSIARFGQEEHTVLDHLVRCSLVSIAVDCCATVLRDEEVPADLLRDLDGALQKSIEGLEPHLSLACERARLISLRDELDRGDWRVFSDRQAPRLKALLLRPLLRGRLATAIRYANEGVAIWRMAPWQALPQSDELSSRVWGEESSVLSDVLGTAVPEPHEFLPLYSAPEAIVDVRAEVASLRVALALRLYRADRGEVAASLGGLVPDYLDEVPPDPFTGKDLLLKRADGMLTVYSVGENLKDDGGRLEAGEDEYERPDTGVRIAE